MSLETNIVERDTPNGVVKGVVRVCFESRKVFGSVEFWPKSFAGQIVHGVSGPFVSFKTDTNTAEVLRKVQVGVEVVCGLVGDRVERAVELQRRLNINEFWASMKKEGFYCENNG